MTMPKWMFCLFAALALFLPDTARSQFTVDKTVPSGGSENLSVTQSKASSENPASAMESPYAPPLSSGFAAITYDEDGTNTGSNHIPPDPIGAVGPSHVVNVVNTSIEWYTKAGVRQNSQSLASFFSSLSPQTNTFDPKVIYDQYEDRFVVLTLEHTDTPATSFIFVAISDDSDPNGTWYFQAIDSKTNITGTDYWADYPGLAVDDEVVYITNNLFTFGTVHTFGGSYLWVLDKGAGSGGLYDGSTSAVGIYDPPTDSGTVATTAMPAHVYGTGGAPSTVGTWLVRYSGATADTAGSGANSEFLSIIRVDNAMTAPTFTHQTIDLGNIEDTRITFPNAPQLGSASEIWTNDRRLLDADWRNDALWCCTTITPGVGADANQATAHWIKIDTSNLLSPALSDQGDISGNDIAPNAFTFFPSIAVDKEGNMGIGFALSASTVYAGAYYTGRAAGDAAGTTQSTGTLQAGVDYYERTFGGTRNRWGDYSGISLDPSDELTFWAFNQYAETRGSVYITEDGRWGTHWGQFTISTTATPTPTPVPSSVTNWETMY